MCFGGVIAIAGCTAGHSRKNTDESEVMLWRLDISLSKFKAEVAVNGQPYSLIGRTGRV
jgi:hypothetical protein